MGIWGTQLPPLLVYPNTKTFFLLILGVHHPPPPCLRHWFDFIHDHTMLTHAATGCCYVYIIYGSVSWAICRRAGGAEVKLVVVY